METTNGNYLESLILPGLMLNPDTTYFWRVMFFDDRNGPSLWSDPFSFTSIISDPNDEDGEWFFIHPLRSVIGEFIGLGPFFDPVAPKDTTIVHIRLLWGDIHYWPPGSEYPEEFIIDGMSLLLSWRN